MKNSLMFILMIYTMLAAPCQAQNLELSLKEQINIKDQPLDLILKKLEKVYKVEFSYSKSVVKFDKNYSLRLTDASIEDCLEVLFAGSKIRYKYIGSQIVLFNLDEETKKKFTIIGYILENDSDEPLIGANVFDQKSGRGVVTNNYGFFSLTLEEGIYDLQFSYIGYASKSKHISLTADMDLNVSMDPSVLTEVVVVASQSSNQESLQSIAQMSRFKPNILQLKKIPTLGGEVDIIKALTLTPGISNGVEGSTGLIVRGGGSDQNLILLDNARVYNAAHLFGFLSVFNPDAVKSLEVYKGGFPARYGGRLSSVVDVSMKEGNRKKITGEAGIGLISSRLLLEGPLLSEKTSFLLTGRSSYLNLFQSFQKRQYKKGQVEDYFNYYLFDINAKINHKIDNKNRIYLSFYSGNDSYKSNNRIGNAVFEERNLNWGNTTSTLRYNRVLNKKLFGKLILNYSRYNYHLETNNTTKGDEERSSFFTSDSRIEDVGLNLSFDYIPSPKHYIKFGAQTLQQKFRPAQNLYESGISGVNLPLAKPFSTSANEIGLYVEDEIKWNRRLRSNLGLRFSGFFVEGEFYKALEPRATFSYNLFNEWAFKASYSFMQQYTHLLVNNSISGLPNDIWVPATAKVPPQKAHQFNIGIAKTIQQYKLDISVEGFYKQMYGLIDFISDNNVVFGFQNGWENFVDTGGKGKSYGVEIFLHKKVGRLSGWAGYTLSWNNRQFDQINNGEIYPFKYDRRHDFSITSNYKFTEKSKWNFSATWIFRTGHAVSLPVARFNSPTQGTNDIFSYPSRNNYRMPAYHRLDLGANRVTTFKNGRIGTLSFSVYNAYNRLNANHLELRTEGQANENGELVTTTKILQKSWFFAIPSISYAVKF